MAAIPETKIERAASVFNSAPLCSTQSTRTQFPRKGKIASMSVKPFRLYDTMTKQVRELQTEEPGMLKFYTCGPTVYSYAHIGNFRSFLTSDLVVRTALALGWEVTWVCNITDVGHLTQDDVSDAEGEDRMAKGLTSKEGEQFVNVWDLADYYIAAFKEDWRKLNLIEPYVRPRATQHIREQLVMTQELVRMGKAYETPTGVYFSVESFPDYGKLSGNRDQDTLKRGVREVVSDDNKQHPADFALWKKDDKHLMQWYSPYGWGFPGWHIECSAMSRTYLGDTLDLHAGGEDNIFPHHECEIAQSEAMTGKPFCNHWVHTRHLQVEGQKMSKSLGNFFTVRQVTDERGIEPLALRLALIGGVYSKPLNFTQQSLRDAAGNIERFKEAFATAKNAAVGATAGDDEVGQNLDDLYDQALDAMCNDLNTPVALAKAIEGAKVILRESEAMSAASGRSAAEFLSKINALLGIIENQYGDAQSAATAPTVDEGAIQAMIDERAAAKAAKDYAKADSIRKQLETQGIELQDTPKGTVWKLKSPE
jgi:cysteinyl-tRNA synthetase